VIYVVVAPDNDFILTHVRQYFRELSTVYELCRLGRHVPFKLLRDGIMRIGKDVAQRVMHESVDDWFNLIGDTPMAHKLKLYAQILKHLLGKQGCQVVRFDHIITKIVLRKIMYAHALHFTHSRKSLK
jgi:mediator of RNA polymerase II transcription subunit 13